MEINELFKSENTLLLVRPEDLKAFGENIASRILTGQPITVIKSETEQPMSQAEAVKFLGKSRQTLVKWRKSGVIQGYRLGGRVYFKPSELVSALHKQG